MIILLEGVMEANGQLLHAGSYGHFEAGSVHHHAPPTVALVCW